jgi:hypothetical protein
MAGLSSRVRLVLVILALAAVPNAAQPIYCCPFCSGQGETLTTDASRAKMVLYGTLANAVEDPTTGDGTTDIRVESAIKVLDTYKDKKTVTLGRFYPVVNDKYRYLVFCDVFQGKVDPYRLSIVDADGSMPKYLKGALALRDEKIGKRLRFFFDFLDSADPEISNDAYKEFANADYRDYRDMAKTLPADRVAGWLKNEKTPAFRFGLYASMLGHCGTKEHASLLRELLEKPERRVGMGVDGMLAGYTMLDPKDGWAYMRDILGDGTKEFLLRYAALRAGRFIHDYRPDLVPVKELTEGVALLLDQKDIADLAIDDLRKWKRWDLTDRILGLKTKAPYEIPIVRRSILRFCLSATDNSAAKQYVADQRQADPQMVADVEELLKLEQTPPPAPGK